MVDLFGELLTLSLVLAPFVLGFGLPIIQGKNGRMTRWEFGAIGFGLLGGPLILASIPRNAGFGVIVWLALIDLVLPVCSIAIARTMRPFLFAVIGAIGYFAAFVYLYIIAPPSPDKLGGAQTILLTFAWIMGPALVMAIPFYFRVRILRKRNRPSDE